MSVKPSEKFLEQARKTRVLALGNRGTDMIMIHGTDGSRLELEPGQWCEVAWGDDGKFERIISGPHDASDVAIEWDRGKTN